MCETASNNPQVEKIAKNFVTSVNKIMPQTIPLGRIIGTPQVGIHISDSSTQVHIDIQPTAHENLPLGMDRIYLASVYKPLMAIALGRLALNNGMGLDTKISAEYGKAEGYTLKELISDVVYISNDGDLAILRGLVGKFIHQDNKYLDSQNETQTAAELVEQILNGYLSSKNNAVLPTILISRSKRSELPEVALPNSIATFADLVSSYKILWQMFNENPDDELLNVVKNAMSGFFDEDLYKGKTHDLRNRLIVDFTKSTTILTKSGNNTNYYTRSNGGHQSIKENTRDPNSYVDVYNCVAIICPNPDEPSNQLFVSYYIAVPFMSSNWSGASRIIRKRLEGTLDKLVEELSYLYN